jgi:hypothetical protein
MTMAATSEAPARADLVLRRGEVIDGTVEADNREALGPS